MGRSSDAKKAANLRRALKEQGRTVTWLAGATGYTRGYVSNVLHGKTAWTEEFQRKAIEALSGGATIPVTYRGRNVHVPEDIYKKAGDLPLIVVESAYEEAWKRSWLQEHAQSTLAVAADRAFQAAQALEAA